MTAKTQMKLAKKPIGRICLHLACILEDGKVKYHSKGILREFKHTGHTT